MTPAQKAGETNHKRAQRRREEWAAVCEDRRKTVEILRAIRDDENAADADRLEAIRLLKEFTS